MMKNREKSIRDIWNMAKCSNQMEFEYERKGRERMEEAILEIIMAENLLKLTEDAMQLSVNMAGLIFQRASLPACCMVVSGNLAFEMFCNVPAMSACLGCTNNVIYGEHLFPSVSLQFWWSESSYVPRP